MWIRNYTLKQKAEGLKKRLCGFELIDKVLLVTGMRFVMLKGNVIGFVTSGTMGPAEGRLSDGLCCCSTVQIRF